MSEFDHATYDAVFANESLLESLREDTRNYCMLHGALMVHDDSISSSVHVPCTVLPLPMPKSVFTSSTELAPLLNFLYDRVARDASFLQEVLATTAESDSFVAMLLGLLKKSVYRGSPSPASAAESAAVPVGDSTPAYTGPVQPLALTLARSDYMMDVDPSTGEVKPLQVEINMIAASFGSLSSQIAAMHRYNISHNPELGECYDLTPSAVPENPALRRIVDGFAAAVRYYEQRHGDPRPAAAADGRPHCVLMVVQKGERNSADQRHLEYDLWERHRIPMIRRSLDQISEGAVIDPVTRSLTVDGYPVALVYYRAAYNPDDLPTHVEVNAMEAMELSLAVKCPSVGHHLAGTKKVQQALAAPGALERFLAPADAERLRTLFAGIWPLEGDGPEVRAVVARAIADPDSYVLKPMREGGGHNMWGQEMVDKLTSATPAERAAFILMAKIRAQSSTQALMRRGELHMGPCISELGVYAITLSDGGKGAGQGPAATVTLDFQKHEPSVDVPAVAPEGTPEGPTPLVNYYAGFLLRTKTEGTNEGGVVAGFSGLNAPYLYE